MIRAGVADDRAAVLDLINTVIAAPHITFRSTPKTDAEMTALMAGPLWVAENAGSVVGYAAYGPFRSSDGYARTAEHSIALSADAQGCGLGRALMQRLEAEAARAGICTLVAGVSGSNPAGIAFHRTMGFAQAGRLPGVGFKAGDWHDLVFMTKSLPPGTA
jgi:phosphinothricin acetyltransferase